MKGGLVVLAAAAAVVLAAWGSARVGTPPPTSSTTPRSADLVKAAATVRVTRTVSAALHEAGLRGLTATTSDTQVAREFIDALQAIPSVSPGACGAAAACVVNCPVDFGINYRVQILGAGGQLVEQTDLDPQGCRFASLNPGGTRQLSDPASPIWTLIAAVLAVPRCWILQPGLSSNLQQCHWLGGTPVPTRAP